MSSIGSELSLDTEVQDGLQFWLISSDGRTQIPVSTARESGSLLETKGVLYSFNDIWARAALIDIGATFSITLPGVRSAGVAE